MSSTMPFITLPDQGLRINLFNVNFIENVEGGIAIHFNDEGDSKIVTGEPAIRIKAFWDGVAETLTPSTDDAAAAAAAADGRDFAIGNEDGLDDPPDPGTAT